MALSPAYEKHPQHTLVFADALAGIRVALGERVLAETRSGLILREGSYPETVYIPREDCDMDRLIRNQATTHCPFKGDATYYDFEPAASAAIAAKPETKVNRFVGATKHLLTKCCGFETTLHSIQIARR